MATVTSTFRITAAVALAVLGAACTMKNQEAPPLTGPSTFGTSIGVSVTPDVLQLDGASQAVVVVTVRDAGGQPMRNVPLRADIEVGGQVVDFGSLSNKSLVTNSEGRASAVYTAPGSVGESEVIVDIVVSAVGSNYENARYENARIRLVPTGIRIPPSDMTPAFTYSPDAPVEKTNVLFDASSSSGTIATYEWDFGDGRTGSGRTTTHAFSGPGTYFVRLTLVDPQGRRISTTRSITVGQGALPTASFTFSPTDPVVGDTINVNGTQSTAAVGRRLVTWAWNFGNGESASGPHATVRYTVARTYTITLTVTDDIGRTHTTSRTLQVK